MGGFFLGQGCGQGAMPDGVTPFASTVAVDIAAPSPKQTLSVVLVKLETSWLVGGVSFLPGGCLPGSLVRGTATGPCWAAV